MTTVDELTAGRPAPAAHAKAGRIPCLDGLRAVAIIIVTIAHIVPAPGTPFSTSWWRWFRSLGAPGVDVFFVISGFLITHLLLREMDATGTVSLRGFYARRALRILPASLFFLTVVAALGASGFLAVSPAAILACLTYTYNLIPGMDVPSVGQLWSLCVEEHFYLIWPASLLLVGRRRAPWLLAGVMLLSPVLRFILWDRLGRSLSIELFTPARLDTIAVGCMLAFFAAHPAADRWARRAWGHADLVAILSLVVFVASVFVLSRSGKYTLGPKRAVEAMAVAVAIFALVNDPRSRIRRLLDSRPMVVIGVLSYSLYLGQTFAYPQFSPGWPLPWHWNLPIVVAFALVSYFLVERPCLTLKDRWLRRKVS